MSFTTICFDCDSTLSKIEGIDELGKRAGLGAELADLTNAAMNGLVPLEAVYEKRLALIKPDQASIAWLADLYIAEQVAGIQEVFATLLGQNKQVHIISGGLRAAILPLARLLGLPDGHVHAVDIYFHEDGSYRDFERASPLAKTGGKAVVAGQLGGQNRLAMVGDGKTDLETKQAGAFIIGFGGVVDRDIVRKQADVFVSEPDLSAILRYL